MKKAIIICCLFISNFSFAQEFATPDTKWVYEFLGAWNRGVTEIYYEKDTVVQSKNLKKFQRRFIRIGYEPDYNPLYFQTNKGVVIVSEDLIHFDTLFNFDASIGKKWTLRYNYWPNPNDSINIEVLDTFHTTINNQLILAQSVLYDYSAHWQGPWIDTVYQDIGTKWSYILPWDFLERAVDGGEGGVIRCFKNEQLGIQSFYHSWNLEFYNYDCKQLSSNENYSLLPEKIKIHPNPFSNKIIVENKSQTRSYTIFNSIGIKVKSGDLTQGERIIQIDNLNSGIYFMKVGKITMKLVKQ